MLSNKVIIVSAPSGSGKTTIVNQILKLEHLKLEFSISACSRKKRDKEIHGEHYYFISIDEFKQKIKADEFLEWEEVYENSFYGTLKSEINRVFSKGNNLIFDVDVIGGMKLKEYFGDNAFSIFIMPPSIEVLESRLKFRSTDSEEAILTRVSKAKHEMQFANKFDKIIINANLQTAIDETISILENFLGIK